MGLRRKCAQTLLRLMIRMAPAGSQPWAEAMLRELEFVDGDWQALWWALGGATAIARSSGKEWLAQGLAYSRQGGEWAMEQMGKKAGWLIVGAAGTVALSLIALGIQFGAAELFPNLGLRNSMWIHLVMVLFIPLAICLGFAVKIWRTRRPVALGILLSAVLMSSHVILHFALH